MVLSSASDSAIQIRVTSIYIFVIQIIRPRRQRDNLLSSFLVRLAF
jgi:hypothetical protein